MGELGGRKQVQVEVFTGGPLLGIKYSESSDVPDVLDFLLKTYGYVSIL